MRLRFMPLLAGACIFLLACASLASQPTLGSICFWPANALLVAILLRSSALRPYFVLTAFMGLVLAYFIHQPSWLYALGSSLADLVGIGLAWYFLERIWRLSTLRKTSAIIGILLGGAIASFSTTVIASLLSTHDGLDPHWLTSMLFGHWLGYSTFLPICLLFPTPHLWLTDRRQACHNLFKHLFAFRSFWPLGALLASLALSVFLGGPGAIAFPIPALLICAYRYQQQATAWLTLLCTLGIMAGFTQGWALITLDHTAPIHFIWILISQQLAFQLLVATPLLVSSSLAARNDTLAALNQALDHDDLTGALSRQAFMRGGLAYLQQSPPFPLGNGVLMLDIDHFKKLNDTYGHAAGDSALKEFSRVIQSTIRAEDLFGRIGGEEFAIVLPNTTEKDMRAMAERLRIKVQQIRLYYDSEEPLLITVSIGAVHDSLMPNASLDEVLLLADKALYQAKRQGRNQALTACAKLKHELLAQAKLESIF